MTSLLGPIRAPQCSSCIRRMAASFGQPLVLPRQQVRGKKTLPKDSTVKVRLLRDVARFGKKGAIIPIAAGKMRNDFLPRGRAEYITKEQLKELGLLDVVLERDFTFGEKVPFTKDVEQEDVMEDAVAVKERKIQTKVELLNPDRAVTILEMLLPSNLDFYRTPISLPPPTIKVSPSLSSSSLLSTEEELAKQSAAQAQSQSQTAAIYGSVTTADIAANLRAILAEDEEGARIVLNSTEIEFVQELDEQDRVKNLGVYEIEIRLKGIDVPVRRTIKVNAQE